MHNRQIVNEFLWDEDLVISRLFEGVHGASEGVCPLLQSGLFGRSLRQNHTVRPAWYFWQPKLDMDVFFTDSFTEHERGKKKKAWFSPSFL